MCCTVELHVPSPPQLGLRPDRRFSLYTIVPHHWSCTATNHSGAIKNVVVKRSSISWKGKHGNYLIQCVITKIL